MHAPSPTECPPEAAFADLLAGRLTAAESGRLTRHVETCEAGRGLLDVLTAGATAETDDNARARPPPRRPDGEREHARQDARPEVRLLPCWGRAGWARSTRPSTRGRAGARRQAHPSPARGAGRGGESRFRREAQAAGALDSPHIVEILDTGEDGRRATSTS